MNSKQSFVLGLFVFFATSLHLIGQQKVLAGNTHQTVILSPSHILANPNDFLTSAWLEKPIPSQYYTEREKNAQIKINNEVSDMVVAYCPLNSEKNWTDIDFEEITPYTWKWVDLEILDAGSLSKISLRRPNWWLKKNNIIHIGDTIDLNLQELDLNGQAIVKNIRINQLDTRFWDENRKGDYVSRPITGKFEHISSNVYQLVFANSSDTLGVTGSHPIWSQDRNTWVKARELNIGEFVKTQKGITALIYRSTNPYTTTVYNLEIYRDHTFLVGTDKILVHNTCPPEFEKIQVNPRPGDPYNPKGLGTAEINAALQDILAGGGKRRTHQDPVTKQDIPTLFKGHNGNERWKGAEEFEVPHNYAPKELGNVLRILKRDTGEKTAEGAIKYEYGWSANHWKNIYKFKELPKPKN